MKNKYAFVFVLLAVIFLVGFGIVMLFTHQREPKDGEAEFTVVTSFYPMYIATENVVGDCEDVELYNLTEPQTGCLHDYQLTTEDMKLLSTADVFVINGGGVESFLADVAAQYPDLVVLDACEGISMTDDNAHVWMSVEKYMQQVENICDGLASEDPAHDGVYRENASDYLGELTDLKKECASLGTELAGRPVILLHEAYVYLAEELGLSVDGLIDLDEERQVSAGEVAQILSAIEEDQVSVVFAEETYGTDMGQRIQKETGAEVLFLDPLTRGDYDADSYLTGMRENLGLIQEAYQ